MSDIVEQALALSQADGCVVIVTEQSTADLRWAGNTLTTNGSGRDRSVTVISVVGESVGVRSTTLVDDLEGLVRSSEQAARDAGPAQDHGPLVEGDADADFAGPAGVTSPTVFAGLAESLGDRFGAARSDGLRMYGYAHHSTTTTWLGSSTGLRKRHVQPRGYVEMTGKSGDPGGSAWVGAHTRDWSDIDVPALDGELRRRLGWASRQIAVPAGRYETILPPSAISDLLIYAYWSSSGRDAAQGRTVFSKPGGGTRVGEAIAPASLTMWSDPTDPSMALRPFVVASASSAETSVFDNGLPLGRTDWIKAGHLGSLIETRASAAATGAAVAPYCENLMVDGGGTLTTDEMVAGTERGLLLTCLWYIRAVDPETLLLTGLTRDGVYVVEDGEVVGAANNFRFNESPLDLLARTTEIGVTVPTLPREWSDDFTWVKMPTVRVPDFNMSSVSQAS